MCINPSRSTIATVAGKPLQPAVVKQIAEGVRKRRVKGVNEDGAILIEYDIKDLVFFLFASISL